MTTNSIQPTPQPFEPPADISVPTLLNLPFLRNGKCGLDDLSAPVISTVIAAGYSSAFLTREVHEAPEMETQHLWEV